MVLVLVESESEQRIRDRGATYLNKLRGEKTWPLSLVVPHLQEDMSRSAWQSQDVLER